MVQHPVAIVIWELYVVVEACPPSLRVNDGFFRSLNLRQVENPPAKWANDGRVPVSQDRKSVV